MINRYRIQNFKSIRDVTVDFAPVTVLVGKSGVGKSNLVDSIRLLRNCLLQTEEIKNVVQSNWQSLLPASNSGSVPRFEVEFSIEGMDQTYRYDLELSAAGPFHPPTEERLRLGDQCLFHQKLDVEKQSNKQTWLVPPSLINVPGPGPLAISRIPSIFEVVIAYTALTSGIGCYKFNDRVLTLPPTQTKRKSEHGLNDDGSNYLESLREIVKNLQDLGVRKQIVSVLQRINPSVSAVELNDILNPTHVVVGHSFNGKTLPLNLSQESDGFRRFYAHLLALFQRPPKQTNIFEHPEDGIHPGALGLLAEEFQLAPDDGRGQVILTTHSPRLLDAFGAEQIRAVQLINFETQVGMIAAEQQESIRDGLLLPGELLTVDPARVSAISVNEFGE